MCESDVDLQWNSRVIKKKDFENKQMEAYDVWRRMKERRPVWSRERGPGPTYGWHTEVQ